jgi:hypothetical protein
MTRAQLVARAGELYASGLTVHQVGTTIHRSKSSTNRLIAESGVPRRRPGERTGPVIKNPGGDPIGTLPAGHPLCAVDAVIMRERQIAALADRRLELRRVAA